MVSHARPDGFVDASRASRPIRISWVQSGRSRIRPGDAYGARAVTANCP